MTTQPPIGETPELVERVYAALNASLPKAALVTRYELHAAAVAVIAAMGGGSAPTAPAQAETDRPVTPAPSEIWLDDDTRERARQAVQDNVLSTVTESWDVLTAVLDVIRPYIQPPEPVSSWHPMTEHPPEMQPVIARTKHGTVGIAYVYKLESDAPQWNFMAMGMNACGLFNEEVVWMHLPS